MKAQITNTLYVNIEANHVDFIRIDKHGHETIILCLTKDEWAELIKWMIAKEEA